MGYLIGFGLCFLFAGIISFFWVRGFDHMQKNHPDYKGDDLFGIFDEDDKNSIGNG
jgi:hypothetical protein